MMLIRLCRFLAVAACLTGSMAEARILPVSQPPARQNNGPQPGEDSDVQALGDLYLLTCFAAVMQGQAIEGEKACSQAIGLDAGNMDAFELRGYAYLLQQRFERAAADFQVVLRSRPKDPDGLAGYGRALSGLGEFDAAVKEFSAAVAAAPKDVPIRAGLCWARGGTGKNLARALADCNTAVKLDPRSASALNSRGMVELRMARFAEAITDYSLALAIAPQQPSAHFGRGLAHLRLGQIAAGSVDIVDARKSDPEIDRMFVTLGVLPQQCGDGKPQCPAGFPPAGAIPGYQTVVLKSYPEENDLVAIEAGRLDLMVDQMAQLLKQPAPRKADETISRADLSARLSLTSARFNGLLPLACRARHIPQKDCAVWHPAWLNAPTIDPVAAVDEGYSHIRPVWAAVCAGNKKACRIE